MATTDDFPEQSEETDQEYNERISRPEDFAPDEKDEEDGAQ